MRRLSVGSVAAAVIVFTSVSIAPHPARGAADTATAAAVITAVERVCLPLIAQQPMKSVASATGLAMRNGDWLLRLGGGRQIRILPPGGSNPTVCTGDVLYEHDGEAPILAALDAWAAAHNPPLFKGKAREEMAGSDRRYHASSWFVVAPPSGRTTVIFTEQKALDGSAVQNGLDEATLLVSVTPQ